MRNIVFWFVCISQLYNAKAQDDEKQRYQTCNFLSRYFSKENQPQFVEILQNYQDVAEQQKAWNKLFVMLIQMCSENLTSEEQYQILTEMQAGTFLLGQYGHIYRDFEFQIYKTSLDLEMSPKEQLIQKNNEEFEKLMMEQQAAQEAQGQPENVAPSKRDRGKKAASTPIKQQAQSWHFHEFLVIGSIGFILTLIAYLACFATQDSKEDKKFKGKKE